MVPMLQCINRHQLATHRIRLGDGVDKLPQVLDLGQQLLLRQFGIPVAFHKAVEVSEVLLDRESDVVRRGQLGRDLLEERLVLCPIWEWLLNYQKVLTDELIL